MDNSRVRLIQDYYLQEIPRPVFPHYDRKVGGCALSFLYNNSIYLRMGCTSVPLIQGKVRWTISLREADSKDWLPFLYFVLVGPYPKRFEYAIFYLTKQS